jgi:hypothetical protein
MLARPGARRPPGTAWLFVKDEAGQPALPGAEEAPVLTASGLPRRGSGGASVPRRILPEPPEPAGPMDPDEVRMRLSAFADGVAAAARRTGA